LRFVSIEKAEYILPIRLDDSDLPGLNPTVGYIDLRTTTVKQVADLLLLKLGRTTANGSVIQKKFGDLDGEFVTYNGHVLNKDWPIQIEEAQYKPYMFVTSSFERIRYGKEKRLGRSRQRLPSTCHDCGVVQGQLHVPGYDMEECPACGGQAISCGCKHVDATEADLMNFEEGEDAGDVIRVEENDQRKPI
jgi:DnaJ-class molecular chaperone